MLAVTASRANPPQRRREHKQPEGIGGLVDVVRSPKYATGVGLPLYGAKHDSSRYFRLREENVYARVRSRMRDWFGEIF